MQFAIVQDDHYFYALKLKGKNACKVGVSKDNFDRVKCHERNYGEISYIESFIVVSTNKKAVLALERQILSDYESYSVANDFQGFEGYSEMLSGDCLHLILEDVQLKADRFPVKKLRIIKDISAFFSRTEDMWERIQPKETTIVKKNKSKSEVNLYKPYGTINTDVLLKRGERIPLFTFIPISEDSILREGPRYFIVKDCYIKPMASDILLTSKGRMLIMLFIKYGHKSEGESYVLSYGEMADSLKMSRNTNTLMWLQNSVCNLRCGAIIESAKGGYGKVNFVTGTKLSYKVNYAGISNLVWDLGVEINIRNSFFLSLRNWFHVPDIPDELYDGLLCEGVDFLGDFYAMHCKKITSKMGRT